MSGKVDAVRLPKEIYFAHRVMQNEKPDLHILGHWSYPSDREDAEDGLRDRQHAIGGAIRQRQIRGRELRAEEWVCFCVSGC